MANTFVPYGFVAANGATMTIAQYNALFALMGITYGGNGSTNFMLPDLCGRVPIGMGLSQRDHVYDYREGEYSGTLGMTLTTNHLPQHAHDAVFTPTTSPNTNPLTVAIGVNTEGTNNVPNPKNNVLAKGLDSNGGQLKNFSSGGATANAFLGGVTASGGGGGITGGTVSIAVSGQSQPFSLMQPYVVINYCISVSGVFPVHQQ